MSNAIQFEQIFNALLVGEPNGARSSDYQDKGMFTLSPSNWQVSYSKCL